MPPRAPAGDELSSTRRRNPCRSYGSSPRYGRKSMGVRVVARKSGRFAGIFLLPDTPTWLGGVVPGGVEHHEDDWEGGQVRVTPDGVESRATSHHGYNYDGGPMSWPSD